jgi:putative hydrolase
VAAGVTDAVGTALGSQLGDLGDAGLPAGMLDQAAPMLRRMHGSMFSMQLGQGTGTLASEVLTGCEVSLPLVPAPTVVLMPAAVRAFAEGLEVDEPQARLYLAVREVARVRLFGAVPWLAPALLAAVRDYAADISIDTSAIEEAVGSIDPSDPEAVQQALQGRMFAPQHSPAQQAALARLETLLALVEGWVDVVADRATREHLPQADALGEAVRRRRATGGPAEKAFGALVGLELRPRRLRDAANLFAALEDSGGQAARDGAWRHPDLAPSTADLDDPLGYVERAASPQTDEMDAALDRLLSGEDDT